MNDEGMFREARLAQLMQWERLCTVIRKHQMDALGRRRELLIKRIPQDDPAWDFYVPAEDYHQLKFHGFDLFFGLTLKTERL